MADNGRRVWRNWLTVTGTGVVATALLLILGFLFFDLLSDTPNPYIGVFTFLIFPGFMIIGIVMMVVGLLRARRRMRGMHGSLSELQYYPRIDLNVPGHRRVLGFIALGIALFLPLVGFMSYEGYHYTDSNDFCGQVCHTVMQPQYKAHRSSPHARVTCAACHIGPGASWYVKSKLSGIRQVLAVMMATYPHPIPAAITELRPARETCEQCHWPEKFYGDQLITLRHYTGDEASTPRTIEMFVKTGGSDPTTGPLTGIHWHMALSHTIEFISLDEEFQLIPWVKSTDRSTNKTVIYRSDGKPTSDPPPDGLRRTMDCMDCHNRATHVFRSLQQSANVAISANPLLRELPYVKRELISALAAPYDSRQEGAAGVVRSLRTFYESNYPDLISTRRGLLVELVEIAEDIYLRSFFPDMNVDWRTYPDNIGHKIFPGCFRCHAGDHVDDRGQTISKACDSCHDFLNPQNGGDSSSLISKGHFNHPVALPGVHAELLCSQCHTGGPAPVPTCEGCHTDVVALREGRTPELEAFDIEADAMDGIADCTDCHDLDEPLAAVQQACLYCHDAEDYGDTVAQWRSESAELLQAVGRQEEGSAVAAAVRALLAAGPLHNIEATRAVLRAAATSEPLTAEVAD